MLENGRIKIIHVFEEEKDEIFFIGKGKYNKLINIFFNVLFYCFVLIFQSPYILNIKKVYLIIFTGLNRDKWHHVTLRINPGTAHLSVTVDSKEMTVSLPSLSHNPSYGIIDSGLKTVMYFGGNF